MRNSNWHENLGNAAVFKGYSIPGPAGTQFGPSLSVEEEAQGRGHRGSSKDSPDQRGLTRDRWCAKKGPAVARS